MDEKKNDGVIELSDEELDELFAEENCQAEDDGTEIPEYYFTNPDPYAKGSRVPMTLRSMSSRSMKTAISS